MGDIFMAAKMTNLVPAQVVDTFRNVFIAGWTYSYFNIATVGANQQRDYHLGNTNYFWMPINIKWLAEYVS